MTNEYQETYPEHEPDNRPADQKPRYQTMLCSHCRANTTHVKETKASPWQCGQCGALPPILNDLPKTQVMLDRLAPGVEATLAVQELPTPEQLPPGAGAEAYLAASEVQPTQAVTGIKSDKGKPDWSLLPWCAMEEVVKVKTWAAIYKYTRDNWRKVPNARRRYFSAGVRHLLAWQTGVRKDPETGLHPLSHALCCFLYLLEMDLTNSWPEDEPDDTDRMGPPKGVDQIPPWE